MAALSPFHFLALPPLPTSQVCCILSLERCAPPLWLFKQAAGILIRARVSSLSTLLSPLCCQITFCAAPWSLIPYEVLELISGTVLVLVTCVGPAKLTMSGQIIFPCITWCCLFMIFPCLCSSTHFFQNSLSKTFAAPIISHLSPCVFIFLFSHNH